MTCTSCGSTTTDASAGGGGGDGTLSPRAKTALGMIGGGLLGLGAAAIKG